jgi:hypothetical protein
VYNHDWHGAWFAVSAQERAEHAFSERPGALSRDEAVYALLLYDPDVLVNDTVYVGHYWQWMPEMPTLDDLDRQTDTAGFMRYTHEHNASFYKTSCVYVLRWLKRNSALPPCAVRGTVKPMKITPQYYADYLRATRGYSDAHIADMCARSAERARLRPRVTDDLPEGV